jgi:hypothetical protein
MASVAALTIAPRHARSGLPIQQFTDLVEVLVSAHGPRSAAMSLARLAADFRRAARETSLAGFVTPRLSLKTSQLDAAADLLTEMTVACWAIPDAPPASH